MKGKILLKDVIKSYPDGENKSKIILNHITLEIKTNELMAIVGKSGSGKTTLLNIIGLLVPPTEGGIFIDGIDTVKLKQKEKSKLRANTFGYIVQDFALIEDETAYENIEIPFFYSTKKDININKGFIIDKVATELEITTLLNKKASVVSGGERQRVAIARALVNNPTFILADEPTGNLDSRTGDKIFEVLKDIPSESCGVILVTHNMDMASQCDRIIEIKNGCLYTIKN